MQLGIARHDKIHYRKWRWISSTGYADFLRWYDGSEGRPRTGRRPGGDWHRCYSSDMLRAVETAGTLAEVPATFMPLFREIPQAPLFDTRVKLPLVVWHVLSRIGWWFNHKSQPEGRHASLQRVTRIVDFLRRQPADQHVLIVTHGFLMYVLRREMKRQGFAGQIPTHPRCGEVYLFERPAEWPVQGPGLAPAQSTLTIANWPGAVRR